MESQEQQNNGPSLLKINTALRDFARLVHSANGVSSLTQETLDMTATQLLMGLLTLCDVTQGAFLLTTQPPGDWRERAPSLTNRRLFPTIVCNHMSKATVLASLQEFSPEGSDFQWLEGETGSSNILIWKRSLAGSPGSIQSQEDMLHETEGTLSSHLQPSRQAFFLFHWQASEMRSSVEAWENVLSPVADAVDAVLANIWLSLRLRELERRDQQREQERMEFLNAELLATVSHELRGPLASIKGYTATLLRHDQHIDQEERYEFLQAIREGSVRLEQLVDRLLELSQIETQKVSFVPMPLNLPSLVQEAIAAMIPFHGANRSVLFLHDNAPLELTDDKLIVNGDRHLLRTLLDHLFENAQLYSPPTSSIEVGICAVEDQWLRPASNLPLDQAQRAILLYPPSGMVERGLLELWIKDHGIGIAPEHLRPIFERFYRVDTRLTREINGLGVGLAMCKGIVELHKGGLWVESAIGAGSTFHILLPQAALS
jgi:signal transduction histidine kinase